jgi:drug/metabolite transporter (DMT)-like permease
MADLTTRAASPFPRSQLLGYIALCLIWGTAWLAIGELVHDVPPLEAAALRFVVAGVLLLSLALAQKRKWPSSQGSWRATIVLSLTIMAVPYGLLFWAEQYVTPSITAILFSAMPLAVALLTPAVLGQKIPRSAVFALVVAFGGFLYLFFQTGLTATSSTLRGGLAVLGAMVLTSWSLVYAKSRLQDLDPVVSTGLQLLFGSVALSWGTWALEARRHAHWTKTSLGAFAFLTVFASCSAFVIYYWLLKRIHPYQLSTSSIIVPIVAVVEEALFRHESIPLSMLIAMAVVLVSVGSVLRNEAATEERQADILMLRGKAP